MRRAGAIIGTTAALLIAGGEDTTAAQAKERHHVCDRVCGSHRYMRRIVRPHRWYLARIASCESGRRWHIATGNGFYGGLQFTVSSWRAVGGDGFPHWASPLEQKYRAVRLSWVQGWGAWPVCRYA